MLVGLGLTVVTMLKVPLAELEESKENVRAALNRAVHKSARSVATASDSDFLYVWNESK